MSKIAVDDITDAAGTGAPNFPNGATGLPDPFGYTAVSGATQALDVGTYNFFDGGTLAVDTTLSFSSVPAQARWTYTTTADVTSAPWDITDLTYTRSFSVATEEAFSSGLFFKPDGTTMYVVGYDGIDVNEYSLSTAWDVSTASYVSNFSVAAQDLLPKGVFFKPDGTVMYVVGAYGQDVNEYSLSTAWNISTASFVRNTSVGAEETQPQSIFFKPDGTKVYVVGLTGDDVNEYAVGAVNSITLPASVQNAPIEALLPEAQVSYTFFTADAGTTVKLINEEVL